MKTTLTYNSLHSIMKASPRLRLTVTIVILVFDSIITQFRVVDRIRWTATCNWSLGWQGVNSETDRRRSVLSSKGRWGLL